MTTEATPPHVREAESPPEAPKVSTTPLSVATFGRLNIVVFRQIEGERSGIFLNIRSSNGGDPTAIPLADIPALVMMLEEIAKPAIAVRSFATPAAPVAAPPPPPASKPKSRKR